MAKLTEEQQVIADRVQAAMTATHPDGSFKYTKEECRAFLIASMIELDLPMGTELEGVFGRFLDQIGVSQTAPEEEVAEGIKAYFADNPLHPGLLEEIQGIKELGLSSRDDYDKDAATREAVARLRGTGQQQESRAPQAAAEKKAPPKVKKGLG